MDRRPVNVLRRSYSRAAARAVRSDSIVSHDRGERIAGSPFIMPRISIDAGRMFILAQL